MRHRKNLNQMGIAGCLALGLLLFTQLVIFAAPTSNVGLTRFEAIPQNNAVRLEWTTATEVGTAGFQIKRTHNGSTDYLRSNGNLVFINAEGEVAFGSDYEYTDTSAENGQVYTYILIEIESSGNEKELDSRTVTAGVEPTATAVSVGGGNGTPPTATPQAAATNTPQPAPTNTPRPTNTPQPAATQNSVQSITVTPQPTATTATTATTNESANAPAATQVAGPNPGSNEQSQETSSTNDTQAEEVARAEDNTVFADELEQTNDPYPAPPVENSGEPMDETSTEQINPKADSNASNGETQVIGGNGSTTIDSDSVSESGAQPAASEPQQLTNSTENRIYLIAGFIVALLIFITAVFGAIVLYTKKNA